MSTPSGSLTPAHVQDAILKSPDNGATLDFQRKGIIDVGQEAVEALIDFGRLTGAEETAVCRIALGYNRLTTLPIPFGLLSRLRYLNLKNNNFSVFPDVLTLMPSLEILDISRNKIKRFPADPGKLVGLRVLSIYRNRLTRLPAYFARFQSLTVLKIEHNEIEWPPKDIMEPQQDLEDPDCMVDWVENIRQWLEDNSPVDALSSTGVSPTHSLDSDPIPSSISAMLDDIGDDESFMEWAKLPTPIREFDPSTTPHARSFSVDSDVSTFSTASSSAFPESLRRVKSPVPANFSIPLSVSSSPGVSPITPSPETSLPTPDSAAEDELTFHDSLSHVRNISDAGGLTSPRKIKLFQKKSLPDLRTARVDFGREVAPALPSREAGLSRSTGPSDRYETAGVESYATTAFEKPRAESHAMGSMDRSAPPMDAERNSYFRRHSTLPSSTISKTVPQPLLALVDAVRGILFALSQIYQSLQHYTVFAIDDRLSSVLLKVLDPASNCLGELIEALDRFDSVSRKGLPSPTVCRGVIESCRDNVSVFGKAIAVLALQLKVLATRDDVRYTRQMLLVLYGAMGEISHSWNLISSHLDAIQPLLREHRPPPSKTTQTAPGRPSEVIPATGSSLPRSQSAQNVIEGRDGHVRVSRRQGGSFSHKDLQLGATMAYKGEPFSPVSSSTPRVAMRPAPLGTASASVSQTKSPSLSPPLSSAVPRLDGHSRQPSLVSPLSTSVPSGGLAPLKVPTHDSPVTSSAVIDKKAIDAVDLAVRAAPPVWDTMDTVLNDAHETRGETRELLVDAQTITRRLQENIAAVQEGTQTVDRKALREDAHIFVKLVVQLSSIVKTWAQIHPLSSKLRHNIQRLTDATQEFVILLHVSSFSPSSTPRPYSPLVTPSSNSLLSVGDHGKGGHSLSRSRSAQTTGGKLTQQTSKEPPRSAMAHQTNFASTPMGDEM